MSDSTIPFYYGLEFDDKGKEALSVIVFIKPASPFTDVECNLDQNTSRKLNTHFCRPTTTHFHISILIASVFSCNPPSSHVFALRCDDLNHHISPNNFPPNLNISSEHWQNVVWSFVYQISGPWRAWRSAPLWPLQRVPPHEEIWGYSTHPPPHCWTSSGRSVRKGGNKRVRGFYFLALCEFPYTPRTHVYV